MCSVQLSMFSGDVPDRDVAELNKKKHTGPLNNKNENAAKPAQTIVSEKEALKTELTREVDLTDIEAETVNPEELHPDSAAQPAPETEKISAEDLAVQKIAAEISANEQLTEHDQHQYLEQIKSIALGCQKCRLAESRTHVVFADGNPDAPIMIIGEGPGEQEDKSGIPFVGKAGQLLDKILESANIHRETDIYITNVVKCRPPENRTPLQDEADACSIYLEKQLELTKARIILLTGATAMKAILNSTEGISKVRGEWIEWKGKWVMPVFHPSYLLRNQSKDVGSPKWLMWQDIKKVKQKFDELKEK